MSFLPPYNYFGSSTIDGILPLSIPRRNNRLWRDFGTIGIIAGVVLTLFGLSLIPVEISRIIGGSLNRQTTGSYLLYPNYNRDLNTADQNSYIRKIIPDVLGNNQPDLAQRGIAPLSARGPNNVNNFPVQDKYLWPWSHAALLFSLVTIAAGVVGIISGCRQTYSTIFTFYTLSLLSTFLSIFLIVYYAVEVYWQKNHNQINRNAFFFHNLDFALGITMLVLSACTFLVSLISALLSASALGIFKGPKAPLFTTISDRDLLNSRLRPEMSKITPSSYLDNPYNSIQPIATTSQTF